MWRWETTSDPRYIGVLLHHLDYCSTLGLVGRVCLLALLVLMFEWGHGFIIRLNIIILISLYPMKFLFLPHLVWEGWDCELTDYPSDYTIPVEHKQGRVFHILQQFIAIGPPLFLLFILSELILLLLIWPTLIGLLLILMRVSLNLQILLYSLWLRLILITERWVITTIILIILISNLL